MKSIPKWAWFIIGFFALGMLTLIVGGFFIFTNIYKTLMSESNGSSGPSRVVAEQLTDLKSGNISAAYNLMSNSTKDTLTEDQFKKMIMTYPELSKNKNENFNHIQISGSQATLDGTLTADDGTVTPIEYRLVLENGNWRIYSIKVNP